jgi:hypothetical protein
MRAAAGVQLSQLGITGPLHCAGGVPILASSDLRFASMFTCRDRLRLLYHFHKFGFFSRD